MAAEALAPPTPWLILPFGLLLAAIALGPLLWPAWWGRHYPKVTGGLGSVTLAYYLVGLGAWTRVGHVAQDYLSFIALVGSLYVVAGGIHIAVKGEATPGENVAFLFLGAVFANLLGTTGASMLLIRPWLRLNRYRVTAHHIVFFIFLVSNAGGCLTPVGDPPLFLGFLQGVPFWWVTAHCWPMWAVGVGLLLAAFWAVDTRNYRLAPRPVRTQMAEGPEQWRVRGGRNLLFLALVLGAVFLTKPVFLREVLMLSGAVGSYLTTPPEVHAANQFHFEPLREVTLLFAGIFATMIPALDWLRLHAAAATTPTPGQCYWTCGGLSSVLDNAPTYLAFLNAALGALGHQELVREVLRLVQAGGSGWGNLTGSSAEAARQTFATLRGLFPDHVVQRSVTADQVQLALLVGRASLHPYLEAISVGAVFFGAATYIGNGPNFLVKAIADHQKVHTPGFLAYILRFTLPFLLPTLLVLWWCFFRG